GVSGGSARTRGGAPRLRPPQERRVSIPFLDEGSGLRRIPMIRATVMLCMGSILCAQQNPSSKAALLKLTDEAQAAIAAGACQHAATISQQRKAAATEARNSSMSDSGTASVDTVLDLLPADTETLIVAQQPFKLQERDPTKPPYALELGQNYALG